MGRNPDCPPEAKALMEEWVKKGIPAVGEDFEVNLPQVMVNQLHHVGQRMKKELDEYAKDKDEEHMKDIYENKMPEISHGIFKFLVDKYISARDEVQTEADNMKAFFRSQKDMPDKTKADVLKEIWAELPKITDKPVPPLDEEMLAELAETPAVIEGEFNHPWGTADLLYKSEAIDAFGAKYLLGVFETKAEVEMAQWSKQEQARLDKDTSGADRIKQALDEARR